MTRVEGKAAVIRKLGIGVALGLGLLTATACTTDQRVGVRVDLPSPSDGNAPVDVGSIDHGLPDDTTPPPPDAVDDPIIPPIPTPDGSIGTAHFSTLPAGRTLPTEAACADMVRRGTPETRPDNTTYNNTIPTADQLAGMTPFNGSRGFDAVALPLGKRVSGNFTGSTDEILQWAACKWGFDEDFVRAESYQVNGWHQAALSGWTNNRTLCPSDGPTRMGGSGTECAQVFGTFGISWQYHRSSWPMFRDSTAFNVDYALALQRVCFEGWVTYWRGVGPPGKVYGPNDAIGCAASFFTGGWYDDTTQQEVNRIRDTLNNKPWKTTTQ